MERILCVSWDPSLSETREMLLRSEGYSVHSACGPMEAFESCQCTDAALLVLGHSVPQTEKKKLIQVFRAQSNAPVLSLLAPHHDKIPEADYGVPADPKSFLRAVSCLLPKK